MQAKTIPAALQGVLAAAHMDGRRGWLLLAVLVLLALPLAGGEAALSALRFERAAIMQGQTWRLLSGHLVHLGLQHWLADVGGLVLLWALFARALAPWQWACVLGGSLLAIDAGLWWLEPQLQWYAGISGLLHGAWAAGCVAGAARRDAASLALLVALVFKLAWEDQHGASLLLGELPVVTSAHLQGAAGGLVALALARAVERWRQGRAGRGDLRNRGAREPL